MPPAARSTDMHTCPMADAGSAADSRTWAVRLPAPARRRCSIGGLPAARVSDMAVCVGPPDTIVQGSATVLIGGLPAARMGDATAHGGSHRAGMSNRADRGVNVMRWRRSVVSWAEAGASRRRSPAARRRWRWSADAEDIHQSLLILLSTRIGERVMVPEYGCALWSVVFENLTTTLLTRIQDVVERAIVKWEPRIRVDDVAD